MKQQSKGFTLIELMIVLTIISILVSIALPVANSAIVRARESVLKSNLYTLRSLIDHYTADKLKKYLQNFADYNPPLTPKVKKAG